MKVLIITSRLSISKSIQNKTANFAKKIQILYVLIINYLTFLTSLEIDSLNYFHLSFLFFYYLFYLKYNFNNAIICYFKLNHNKIIK